MLKKSMSLLCFIMLAVMANAQLHHAVGGGLLAGVGKLPEGADASIEETPMIMGYGIYYQPRYNLKEMESGSLSVSLPMTLGLSGSVNSREGGNLSITADLPVTFDYNFGAASTEDNGSGFGGFIGAGFGYTYTNQTYEYTVGTSSGHEQLKGVSYGPLAQAGLRAVINERTYFVRGFFKMGMEKEKFKTVGLSVGLSF